MYKSVRVRKRDRANVQLYICTIVHENVRERNIDLFNFFSAWIYVIFR